MSFSFGVGKGVRLYPSSRGVSAGVGPVRYYRRVGRASRGRGSSVAAQQRQVRQAQRLEDLQTVAATEQELLRFCEVHKEPFVPATHPVVAAPEPLDENLMRKQLEAEALQGLSILKRAERREAKAQVRERLPASVAEEEARRRQEVTTEQKALDQQWERLIANDPDTVVAALEQAFADNEAPAVPLGCEGSRVHVLIQWPPVDEVVPERKPALTPSGNPTIHKRKVGERDDMYLNALCSHALATIKETFAECPNLEEVGLVVVRGQRDPGQGDMAMEPLLLGTVRCDQVADMIWDNVIPVAGLLEKLDGRVGMRGKGAKRALFPLDLSDEEATRDALAQVADPLGWRVPNGGVPGVATPLSIQVTIV